MATKFRKDLPTRTNARFSQRDVDFFNKNRRSYHRVVWEAERIFKNSKGHLEKSDELNFTSDFQASDCNGLHFLILNTAKDESRNGVELVEQKYKRDARTTVDRCADLISAFYFPENTEWVNVYIGGQLVAKYSNGRMHCADLEDLLQKSWQLPEISDKNIDYILWNSSNLPSSQKSHGFEDEKVIDGQVYKRMVLVHPFIPLISLQFHAVQVETLERETFFIEGIYLDVEMRDRFAVMPGEYWVDNSDVSCPILRTRDGLGGLATTGCEEEKFHSPAAAELSKLDKELLDNLKIKL